MRGLARVNICERSRRISGESLPARKGPLSREQKLANRADARGHEHVKITSRMHTELSGERFRIKAVPEDTLRELISTQPTRWSWDVTALDRGRRKIHGELELRSALRLAEQAVRERDQLVSLVSRDLKSPLSALLTGITVLGRGLASERRRSSSG